MCENGSVIITGNVAGDEEGEYTFIGPNGKSTIDYLVTNCHEEEKVQTLKIGQCDSSDHMPSKVELCIEACERQREKDQKEGDSVRRG